MFKDAANIKAIYDADSTNFKANFHGRSFANVPPTGATNSPRINYNLLNNQRLSNVGLINSNDFEDNYKTLIGTVFVTPVLLNTYYPLSH